MAEIEAILDDRMSRVYIEKSQPIVHPTRQLHDVTDPGC